MVKRSGTFADAALSLIGDAAGQLATCYKPLKRLIRFKHSASGGSAPDLERERMFGSGLRLTGPERPGLARRRHFTEENTLSGVAGLKAVVPTYSENLISRWFA